MLFCEIFKYANMLKLDIQLFVLQKMFWLVLKAINIILNIIIIIYRMINDLYLK